MHCVLVLEEKLIRKFYDRSPEAQRFHRVHPISRGFTSRNKGNGRRLPNVRSFNSNGPVIETQDHSLTFDVLSRIYGLPRSPTFLQRRHVTPATFSKPFTTSICHPSRNLILHPPSRYMLRFFHVTDRSTSFQFHSWLCRRLFSCSPRHSYLSEKFLNDFERLYLSRYV